MSSPKKTAAEAEGNTSPGIETLSIPKYRKRLNAKLNDAVDYGDGDVEVEEGEASSSKRKESIDSDSLGPHAGSRLSTNTITNRLPAAVVGTRPGYGQPGVDLGPTLEERVAAVEQHQSREFAALKQEDISVDVGGRVSRLAQRVHALEQRFAPAGASASVQQS
ncbi:hypothetical protein PHYSODRAFT_324553 [Phytophthora sojae]|uniref:Uncharacterized protein n=1 Tax=Phytophthora sojae (strain P6497) TaxID=1094619 RepID=G4YZW5_PHYSP|nr:hypothetical protein PHYSODRAFT_324553 [Phytophthora sojae]EGZ23328.1 hypothetical protein PHYSODRAFT_324553 [Phytophthora sojae]|eukprot:XP_009518616.1 hypothetical protein PHYSODRAFT_324553 [Phytophthora sojae]